MNYHRGHPILFDEKRAVWVYVDTRNPVPDEPARDCGRCGQPNTPEGHDACLGTLPGVRNACCGHGDPAQAYVMFENGRRIPPIYSNPVTDDPFDDEWYIAQRAVDPDEYEPTRRRTVQTGTVPTVAKCDRDRPTLGGNSLNLIAAAKMLAESGTPEKAENAELTPKKTNRRD